MYSGLKIIVPPKTEAEEFNANILLIRLFALCEFNVKFINFHVHFHPPSTGRPVTESGPMFAFTAPETSNGGQNHSPLRFIYSCVALISPLPFASNGKSSSPPVFRLKIRYSPFCASPPYKSSRIFLGIYQGVSSPSPIVPCPLVYPAIVTGFNSALI